MTKFGILTVTKIISMVAVWTFLFALASLIRIGDVMKKYRRIEITAFRRRVTIVSSELPADKQSAQTDSDVWLKETDSPDTIATESDEGQEILIEAVRVLEQKLSDRARRAIFK